MMVYNWFLRIFALSLMICLTGCFSSNPANIQYFLKPDMVDTTADTYVLEPPDEVIVYCSKVSEINEQRQKIRPDGKISFEEVGELQAAGKTPSELAEDLRAMILDRYKSDVIGEKSVDVRIYAFQSKVYYVFGQVYEPGPRIYTGRDSLVTAIAIAQPNPMAWIERIQVIRPSNDKNVKAKVFEVNFDRLMAHGDTSKDVLLQEGDIIYVPPTVLGWMALKIEEVIRPIARAFSGIYTVRRGLDNQGYYY
jgi:polysaccharide export outer membrane protein